MSDLSVLCDMQEAARALKPKGGGATWREPSANSQYVHRRSSIAVPAPNTTNTAIVNYTCQAGFRSVITHVLLVYIGGSPPTEGDAAELYYSLRLNSGYFVRDFESITTTLGSLTNGPYPIPDGIRLTAGNFLEALVTVPLGSPIATGAPNRVHAHLLGWEWPENE